MCATTHQRMIRRKFHTAKPGDFPDVQAVGFVRRIGHGALPVDIAQRTLAHDGFSGLNSGSWWRSDRRPCDAARLFHRIEATAVNRDQRFDEDHHFSGAIVKPSRCVSINDRLCAIGKVARFRLAIEIGAFRIELPTIVFRDRCKDIVEPDKNLFQRIYVKRYFLGFVG